jgi:predicted DNA-binding transcriptional regulator AlpA
VGVAQIQEHASNDPDYADRLINEQEAANFLGYSVRALQNWRLRGGGPQYVRVSRRSVRYRRRDLTRWADEKLELHTSEQDLRQEERPRTEPAAPAGKPIRRRPPSRRGPSRPQSRLRSASGTRSTLSTCSDRSFGLAGLAAPQGVLGARASENEGGAVRAAPPSL